MFLPFCWVFYDIIPLQQQPFAIKFHNCQLCKLDTDSIEWKKCGVYHVGKWNELYDNYISVILPRSVVRESDVFLQICDSLWAELPFTFSHLLCILFLQRLNNRRSVCLALFILHTHTLFIVTAIIIHCRSLIPTLSRYCGTGSNFPVCYHGNGMPSL